jgi:RND family efflux transporter MFP subunit
VIENDAQKTLLNQAKISLEQAELNHELKLKLFAREKKLFEQKVISQEAYDLSENSYKTTELLLDQSKASIKTAQINYNNCFVKAPFSGVIVSRFAQKGEYVAMGSPIARIVDTKNLQVIVGLTHLDLLKYKKSQHKDVEIILSDKSIMPGKIRGVAEAPDKQTSLYSMKILFEGKKDIKTKKRLVFPGMQLLIALRGEEYKNAFKIRRNSMKFLKNRYFIFIAEDGKVIKKEVEILADIAKMNIARFTDNSIKPFNIITTGIDALTDGKSIEIVKEQ